MAEDVPRPQVDSGPWRPSATSGLRTPEVPRPQVDSGHLTSLDHKKARWDWQHSYQHRTFRSGDWDWHHYSKINMYTTNGSTPINIQHWDQLTETDITPTEVNMYAKNDSTRSYQKEHCDQLTEFGSASTEIEQRFAAVLPRQNIEIKHIY